MNVSGPVLCLIGAMLSICALVAVSISWVSIPVFFALIVDAVTFICMAVWFILN